MELVLNYRFVARVNRKIALRPRTRQALEKAFGRMGAAGSKAHRLEKALGSSFPENEHVFGLENFGNTCYCNSVLQALYYCQPLRERCLEHRTGRIAAPEDGGDGDGLLGCLCELFWSISSQKKRCGVLAPKQFIIKLRAENELFNNHMHQVHRMIDIIRLTRNGAAVAGGGR